MKKKLIIILVSILVLFSSGLSLYAYFNKVLEATGPTFSYSVNDYENKHSSLSMILPSNFKNTNASSNNLIELSLILL